MEQNFKLLKGIKKTLNKCRFLMLMDEMTYLF